jgi:rod shape determining protein RodA
MTTRDLRIAGLRPLPGLAPVRPASAVVRPRGGRLAGVRAVLAPARRFDGVLVAAVLGLGLLGVLLVWSATAPALAQAGADPHYFLRKQVLNLGLGVIMMVVVGLVDVPRLRALAPLGYLATLLALLVVVSPLGTEVNGARAWIALPAGFQLEPSEYAKLGLILMMAWILGARADGAAWADGGTRAAGTMRAADARPGIGTLAAALACAAPIVALVAAEPALGVTAMLMVLLIGLIVLAGTRLRWLAALAAAAGSAVFAFWWLRLLKPYQLSRLAAFVHPSADLAGTGYSAAQAKIAVGSGRLLGQGLFHGQLVAGSFVPELHTDFIFAVAGEELGFVGAVAIVLLISVIVGRALLIAWRANDRFGMLLAGGIAIWFAVQAFVNIGMTVGIVPVTGLPLPFVSYGGSAMFADMLAIGVLQSVRRAGRAGRRLG